VIHLKSRRSDRATLYEQLAERITRLIEGGTLRPGDRIPSVRKLSAQMSVSVTTVLEAYRLLEDRALIEARPQSGYYVRTRHVAPPEPAKTVSEQSPSDLAVTDLVMRTLEDGHRDDLVSLGAAIPSPEFLPTERLNRILARVVRQDPRCSQSYDTVAGYEPLRVQVARRLLEAGCSVTPDEIITTSGAQEAVHLCLRAVTQPGDTVIVESPTYYGLLEALESLHLKALEIATDPRDGICLEDLGDAVASGEVAACALVPSFGNPLGHCMPDDKKRELVRLLAEAEVPLVEDDVYGDLCYDARRPRAVKAFDETGNVLLCSSFSKTLAPGYRIGWAIPGRHTREVERLKFSSAVATATPTQMAVAAFLESGGFDRYLRRLRRTYQELVRRMTAAVAEHFPEGTRVPRPRGGHVLWIELPEGADSLKLHEDALAAGISIAPGPIFSACERYQNFIRLNCAVPWSPRVEEAVRVLGSLVWGTRQLLRVRRPETR
jgi:DNA-binding transcriptional MocR family regulator